MDDATEIGNAAYNLAMCHTLVGQFDQASAAMAEAKAAFDRAAALFQKAKHYRDMAITLRRAGEAYREAGDTQRAEDRLFRAKRSLAAQGEKAE